MNTLEQHHAFLLEQLAREALAIARSSAISKEQRLRAMNEARSFSEIAQNIREQLASTKEG